MLQLVLVCKCCNLVVAYSLLTGKIMLSIVSRASYECR